jgi:hypothetical protein
LFAVLATAVSQLVGLAAFLLIAPLAPLAGVSASFGGGAEPASELVLSCPYSTLRLLMLRTSAVLVSAVPVAIAVGLALPGSSWFSVAWLLPAAAVVLVTLALGPALGHTTSAAVVGATWAMAVVISLRLREPAVLVEPAVQSVYLLVAVAAALSVVHHYRSSSLTWRRT